MPRPAASTLWETEADTEEAALEAAPQKEEEEEEEDAMTCLLPFSMGH